MTHQDPASFVRQVKVLPSLPTLYYEINQAVSNPNSSIDTIGEIVRKDQSLTSRLLKLANSALYCFPSQVETIEEALQLIGLKEMCDLALATCVINTFKDIPEELVNVQDFWKHSIACAIASGLLAEKNQDSAPERFFVGGLLHDIGRLIMYLKAKEESLLIIKNYHTADIPPCQVERQVLGFDHAALGAELLSAWRLPPKLIDMVRGHHNPARYQNATGDDSIIHCADFIANALALGNSGEVYVSPIVPEASKRCGLDDIDLVMLAREIEDRCEQLFPMLVQDEKKPALSSHF